MVKGINQDCEPHVGIQAIQDLSLNSYRVNELSAAIVTYT